MHAHRREMKTATRLARELWSPEGMALTPRRFVQSMRRINHLGMSWRAKWLVGGALADYLCLHPATVDVPTELVGCLCASRHVDSRVIGIKLLFRSVGDVSSHIGRIRRAFNDESPEVRIALVYEIVCRYREPSALRDPVAWIEAIREGMNAAAKDRRNLNWRNAKAYLAYWQACGFGMGGGRGKGNALKAVSSRPRRRAERASKRSRVP